MTDTDYKAILDDAFIKLGLALQRRDEAEIEIAKQRQFILATMNMVSDEERQSFRERLIEIIQRSDTRSAGLTEAIRKILQAPGRKWMTVTEVRTHLVNSGFDFSGYTANPLASISTTLRRMAPNEAETTTVQGVTAYRWKVKPARMAEAFRNAGRLNKSRYVGRYGGPPVTKET
jgi:hypothetical protein